MPSASKQPFVVKWLHPFRLCLLPLLALSLSACEAGGPGLTIGIGLDPVPCAAAGNPSACRMQRDLAGEYTQPNARSR